MMTDRMIQIRTLALLLIAVLILQMLPMVTDAASGQVYYSIDFSAAVLKSRTNQQVSGDCGVVSMVTTESYLYGATSATDKKTVYDVVVKKNTSNSYANWSYCGYVKASIDWERVYEQLEKGYPCLIHRPAVSGKAQHWAVVAGYKGSTSKLEAGKFIVVDVYHGSNGKDIYTSSEWATGTSVDAMVYRKNGVSVTGLAGVRFAINHPSPLHPYGEGHGVYGYITASENLTKLDFQVVDVNTGAYTFRKTVTPNSKSYLIYDLDSAYTFAKWAKGEYLFTVVANTADAVYKYQKYFTIASEWPATQPKLNYTFRYDLNGGSGNFTSQTVAHGAALKMPTEKPSRSGTEFLGWNVQRKTDGKWYCYRDGWATDDEITAQGYTKHTYGTGMAYTIGYDWIEECMINREFIFHAVWDVPKVELTGIEIASMPHKSVYNVGEAFSVEGLSLRASYSDGTQKLIEEGYTYSGFDSTTPGVKTVTVTLNGESTQFAVTVLANAAESDAQIVVSRVNAQAGSRVNVEISLKNNPGVVSAILRVEYDKNLLKLVEVKDGGILGTAVHSDNLSACPYVLCWANDLAKSDYMENGTLATLVFEVLEGAPLGDATVSVSYDDGNFEIFNAAGNEIHFATVSGGVCVTDVLVGDVNGDGKVNAQDRMVLTRYLAKWDGYGESTVNMLAADVNGDGKVNAQDRMILTRYLAKWDGYEILPCSIG